MNAHTHTHVNSDLNNLLFRIHQQRFLEYIVGRREPSQEQKLVALKYGRAHLAQFHPTHMKEVQRLFCCLIFDTTLPNSPYADLVGGSADSTEEAGIMGVAARTSLRDEFITNWCCCLGMARVSPLSVALDAGALALGQLLKLINVMESTGGGAVQSSAGAVASTSVFSSRDAEPLLPAPWERRLTSPSTITTSGGGGGIGIGSPSSPGELPVELHLGDEYVFQSIFSCPVSREQSTPSNPPMLLPCGHVLCKGSVQRLGRGAARIFKCPYCPKECTMGQCRELHF